MKIMKQSGYSNVSQIYRKFYAQAEDPQTISRLYERIIGERLSSHLTSDENEEREFAKAHPYWVSKSGLLKDNANWNGEPEADSFKKITEILKEEANYFSIYKLTSKFAHGSPIVKNIYSTKLGLSLLASPTNVLLFNFLGTQQIMKSLEQFCIFFGIEFPGLEHALIQQQMLACKKIIEGEE